MPQTALVEGVFYPITVVLLFSSFPIFPPGSCLDLNKNQWVIEMASAAPTCQSGGHACCCLSALGL